MIEQRCPCATTPRSRTRAWRCTAPELIAKHALAVYQQAAVLKLMPQNNATGITDDERSLIKRWYEAGARPD